MVLELTQRPCAAHVLSDPGIPTLPAVLDAIALGTHLRALLPSAPAGSQEVHVRPLRHHAGNRCVVEVTWRRGKESLSLIGKVYATDRSDVYRVMEEIRRAGLGPHAEFSIPQPMAYLPALQLLLQEKVEGRPATESFLSDDDSEWAAAAERCARWLVEFHAVAPRIGPRFDLGSHVLSMERWVRRFGALGEPFADKARALLKRLEAAASQLPPTDTCTIHGDYSHHQVLLAPGRTVTVDWDRHGLADPSHDVARFAVGLQRLAQRRLGSMRALDRPADVFLKAYVVGAASWDSSAHLAFHRAAICLEHAKHDVRKQAPGWPERAAAALDEGLRVLAHGG